MEKIIILMCVFAIGFGFGAQWMKVRARHAFIQMLEDLEEEFQKREKQ